MAATFNPNEVVFEKIRYIEEFDPTTQQLLSRLTNVKDPAPLRCNRRGVRHCYTWWKEL